MDFPMMNEINENTNAAKKEILEAMPAAGATSAEVEAAKTAIIGAMPSGGDAVPVSVTPFDKSSTNSSEAVAADVTGNGYARFHISLGSAGIGDLYVTATVDGVKVLNKFNSVTSVTDVTVRFKKSFKLVVKGTSNAYKGTVKGYVCIEE